jgi:hypothetical protein
MLHIEVEPKEIKIIKHEQPTVILKQLSLDLPPLRPSKLQRVLMAFIIFIHLLIYLFNLMNFPFINFPLIPGRFFSSDSFVIDWIGFCGGAWA